MVKAIVEDLYQEAGGKVAWTDVAQAVYAEAAEWGVAAASRQALPPNRVEETGGRPVIQRIRRGPRSRGALGVQVAERPAVVLIAS